MECGPLACLGREEVAPLLARQPGHDDAAHAHGARPGQRLRIHAGVDHEDRTGEADVEPPGAQAAVRAGRHADPAARRPAERDDAADAAPGRADRDRGAGPDVADDAGERGLDRVDDVAGGHAPAVLPREQVLPADGGAAMAGRDGLAGPRRRLPALARERHGVDRDVVVLETAVAQSLRDRRTDDDRGAGLDQHAVARGQPEGRIHR